MPMERIEIGGISGAWCFVESRRPIGNRSQRKTISYRSGGWTVVVIGILHLALAWASYTWRMLFAVMLVRLVPIFICTVGAHAQNATWLLNPGSGDFDTAGNWSTNTVPTGTATFGASNTTAITSSTFTQVGTLQFNPGAPGYSFTVGHNFALALTGTGIINNSSNQFTINNNAGVTDFENTSTAGNATINNISIPNPPMGLAPGLTEFLNASTAGNATINNNSGFTGFSDTSAAGNATISNSNGGSTSFLNTSTGGQARLITNAGGSVDISGLTSTGMTAGSIEGAGTFALGSKALAVGLNNLSTLVSGTITDGGSSGGVGGSLIKVGTGTLTLTGANTYSGGTSFNKGILAVMNDSNLGNGALTFNGGTLEALAGITSTKTISIAGGGGTFLADTGTSSILSGSITGTASLTKDGPGTLTLSGSNTYGLATAVVSGILKAGSSTALSANSAFSITSVLDLNGFNNSVGSLTGTGTVLNNGETDAALAVGNNNASTIFSGVLQNGTSALQITKSGTGTLTLTGANTYSGGTTIAAGTLQIGNGGTTGSIAGNVTNNGILAFDRSDAVTFAGVISGTGSVQDLGGGTITLTGSDTYSGGTVVNNGMLIVATTNALGTGPVSVNDPSLLQINPGVTIANQVAINDGGSLINGGRVQVSAVPSGPVAAVTTSGGATITNESSGMIAGFGLIAIQSASGSATVTNSGIISGTEGIALSNGGTVTNNAGGTISGSNGTAIASAAGSTNFTNAGIINGNVTLGNGANTVQLFSGSRISGSLNLGTSAGSNLILDGSSDQTYSQAVTGQTINAGSLTKQGSGNWLIDIAMNAPVSTNILAGVLTINGSVNSPLITVHTGGMLKGSGVIIGNVVNLGTLAPGNSPGTLTINGNFTQGPAGIYNVQIASAQNYSRLVVTGSANLDGTLRLTLASGFQPAAGESFTVLTAVKGINGTFRLISTNTPVNITYSNGVVDVSTPFAPKPQIHLSDGTPVSTTALIANYTFYGFGSLAERTALGLVDEESAKPNAISLTFDAGEFDVQGHHGQTYTIPIAGGFKINDRARLDYEIPLQYITLEGTGLMQAGLTLDLPFKAILPFANQPWSWDVTPTVAFASSGSREIIGGGALSNVLAYRWRGITITYGNYISFFKGDVLTENDPKFPTGVNQQIMKNGLRLDIPVAKSWLIDLYGIQTQFFQSATVSSYVTLGAELGRHFFWKAGDQNLDLGYLSFGFYTEVGNHYSSGHFQFGSAWRF